MVSRRNEGAPAFFAAPGYENILAEATDEASILLRDSNGTAVWQFDSSQGPLILRRPGPRVVAGSDPVELLRQRIDALHRGLNVTGLEQTVYFSKNDEVVVTKYAGLALDDLPDCVMQQITPHNWNDALRTLEEATRRNICFDLGAATNILFQPRDGFTFIDYRLDAPYFRAGSGAEQRTRRFQHILDVVDLALTENTYDQLGNQTATKWQEVTKLAMRMVLLRYRDPEDQDFIAERLEESYNLLAIDQ